MHDESYKIVSRMKAITVNISQCTLPIFLLQMFASAKGVWSLVSNTCSFICCSLPGAFSSCVTWDVGICCTCSCSGYRQKASHQSECACASLDRYILNAGRVTLKTPLPQMSGHVFVEVRRCCARKDALVTLKWLLSWMSEYVVLEVRLCFTRKESSLLSQKAT